jgi:RNase adaptor protein for sRNA GlmZ degradation
MFTALKESFQKRALKSLRSKISLVRDKRFTPFKQVSNILLLYKVENENKLSELYSFISKIKANNVEVEVDVLIVGKSTNLQSAYPKTANFYRISFNEVTWNGTPRNEDILKLLQNNHDYLIDLSRLESHLCAYLATASLAKFKVGVGGIDNSPFDFTIDVDRSTDISFFDEQMLAYLQRIG